MQIHASCAAKAGAGVLIVGAAGSGKSDLLLRLLDRGFCLVADDQVVLEHCVARPVPALAGLLEVRGLGLLRLDHLASATLVLVVELISGAPARLPHPRRHAQTGLTLIQIDARAASAPQIVALALDCATGLIHQPVGAFAA